MNLKRPLLFGLLLCLITIAADGLILEGIIAYFSWDKSFIVDRLWDFNILCLIFISLSMTLVMGNVVNNRLPGGLYLLLILLMWGLLMYRYTYYIYNLTVLRIGLTQLLNALVLFTFIHQKIRPQSTDK